MLVDVPGLFKFGREKNLDHVITPLLGQQVKGEDHTRQHLLHCVNVTSSGIPVHKVGSCHIMEIIGPGSQPLLR